MVAIDPVEHLSPPTVAVFSKINAFITAKNLDFLSNNRYKVLFILALISYGVFDFRQEKGSLIGQHN